MHSGLPSAGNDAFFIRSDQKPSTIPELTPQQGFIQALARESRDTHGALVFLAPEQELEILRQLPLVEVSPDGSHRPVRLDQAQDVRMADL